ncbi:unnamed protein product [Paramecium sonneborni]|uniref:Uncharacterized protein n=1 Tax=Paramecium sonneborni TaxID=65129 RepID=A0A8S1RP87_9CILI|nr:unnamed protein product [Paramecium sonneborni]
MNYPISPKIMNNQSFSFEFTSKYKYRQRDEGLVISIDPTNTLLIISSKKYIRINQFKHGYLKQLQQIYKHLNTVCILNFSLKNLNLFLDQRMLKFLYDLTKLIGNSQYLQCLIKPSKSDELIIYATNHKNNGIRFHSYSTLSTWSFIQCLDLHSSMVLGLSINEEANKIISWGKDCLILIMECSDQSLWHVKYKISTQSWDLRICFINSSLFAFLPNENDPFKTALKNIHFYIFSELQIEG